MSTTLRTLCLLFAVGFLAQTANTQTISDFKLDNLDNERTSYQELKGERYTIIDFWATWCKPCVKAMPHINEIYNDYKDQGVNVIGIACDGPRSVGKVGPVVSSKSIDYPILLDLDSEVMQRYHYQAFPTLLIVDAKTDKVVLLHEGFFKGDELYFREEIEQLLRSE